MIPLLGRTLILASLLVATAGTIVGFAAGARRTPLLEQWARRFAYTYAAAMTIANLLMVYALVVHDFSVSYVAQVGSRALPLWVSVVSLWSSLEGSILFWGLVLGLYIAFATRSVTRRHQEYSGYAIGTWLACATFFSFLIAGPAQPFNTVSPAPIDGPGPNPLLQNHLLMIVHPPFLYLGYVGMTIPFGFACAALLRGRLSHGFTALLRTSLLLPWTFLTMAIILGGWWAYEVLGWGGYWAWDPVENASLLPWLTATAALHSAIVMERRGMLRGWTMTLYLATFLLTILGTFMTRSGVFNSVHSFTQSSIGPTILVFLAVALIASVILLAMRIDRLAADRDFDTLQSREAMFMVNNLLFVLITFTVLVGTVFPLVVEAVKNVQMSVGRPYFDKMTVPVGVALLFLMGVGPALPWGRASREQMRRGLLTPMIGAAVALAPGLLAGVRHGWTLLTIAFAGYTLYVTVRELLEPARQRRAGKGETLARAFYESQIKRGRRRVASYIVHLGAVILFIAIAVSSTMSVSREVQLGRGESTELGRYTLTFLGAREVAEPHRSSTIAQVRVMRGDEVVGILEPRMNHYPRQREPIGTPDVMTRLTHDLYLSIMNIDVATQQLGLNAMINPMIAWVWGATALMAIGGFAALFARSKPALVHELAAAPQASEIIEEAG